MFISAWLKTVRSKLIDSRRRRMGRPDEVEVLEPRMVLSATAFSEGQSFEFAGGGAFLPAADLDGDHDLDLVASGVLLRNDGSGHFTPEERVLPALFARGAFGDVDHDGDLDAFLGTCSEYREDGFHNLGNEVWLNDGTGRFSDSGQLLGDSLAGDVALADLDADGDLDAFAAGVFGGAHTVWVNDGTGQFQDSGQMLLQSNSCETSVAIADFDGDGDLDAFTGMNDGTRLLLNDGHGRFKDSGQRPPDPGTRRVAAGDLDGDGDLDLYLSGLSGDCVLLNDGTGKFLEQRAMGVDTYDSRLGDLDNDGDLDVFLANRNWKGFGGRTTELALINDGTGHFQFSGHEVLQEESRGVDLADLDGDGDLDGYSPNDWNTRIWINQPANLVIDAPCNVESETGESEIDDSEPAKLWGFGNTPGDDLLNRSDNQESSVAISNPDEINREEEEPLELVNSPDSEMLNRGDNEDSSIAEEEIDSAATDNGAEVDIAVDESDAESRSSEFDNDLLANEDIDAKFVAAWKIDDSDGIVT